MRRAVRLHSCQTVTPETDDDARTTSSSSRAGSTRATTRSPRRSTSALLVAFEEDRAMITAQSRAIDADPGAPMLPLAMDAAVVRFRKLVAETIAAERGEPARRCGRSAGAGTSATRARSPGWRASRSRPSARAASATGPRLVVHVLVELGGRRMGAEDRLERRLGQRRRQRRLELAHQRAVLVGADRDAAAPPPARAGGTGRSPFRGGDCRDSVRGAVMAGVSSALHRQGDTRQAEAAPRRVQPQAGHRPAGPSRRRAP